jgi:transcriptional regulator with XRE-family HTH domain
MAHELTTLATLRLEQDLSYAALGQLIGLRRQTLYRLLNTKGASPNDRSLYKIRQFLAANKLTKRLNPHDQHDRWEEVRGQR